jgi:uncharacterized protein (DUF58 family)
LPTVYGFCFAAVCMFLLAIAYASTNNAVYLLCFVISALGIQSLIITNKNTDKMRVNQLEIPDFFADEPGFGLLHIANADTTPARNFRCEMVGEPAVEVEIFHPEERRPLRLPISTKPAGFHKAPKVKVSSDFPFYFSRSWRTYVQPFDFAVYPARVGTSQFSSNAFLANGAETETQDDFKGHRDYRDNDTPRSIDWKVSSRVQKLTVKEYDQQSAKKIRLRWQDANAPTDAQRRSQLSLWVDLAEKRDFEYAVELPSRTIDFGRGPAHKALCLRALL